MFKKDILLFDVELTGLDVKKHEIIQLAAVLLDRKTLKIKKEFGSLVKPAKWHTHDPEAIAVANVQKKDLATAPKILDVMKEFDKVFSKDVTVAHYGGLADLDFLRLGYSKLGKKYGPRFFPYDYHVLDLWPIFYSYAALHGMLTNRKRFTGFSLEDLMTHFKINTEGRHDAMVDCQVEAEIFRRIMLELKKKV